MDQQVRGCGQSNTQLTLYHVGASGQVRALRCRFALLVCGHQPATFEFHSYGILLCKECADRLGFPAYSKE